jgi:hypothetical protein
LTRFQGSRCQGFEVSEILISDVSAFKVTRNFKVFRNQGLGFLLFIFLGIMVSGFQGIKFSRSGLLSFEVSRNEVLRILGIKVLGVSAF